MSHLPSTHATTDNNSKVRKRSNDILRTSSKPFYVAPPAKRVKQVVLESPILHVLQYTPMIYTHTAEKINGKWATEYEGEKLVICGCLDGTVHVYNLEDLKLVHKYSVHTGAVTCMKVYQPPGESLIVLLTGGKDNLLKLTILTSGENVGVLEGHKDAVWSIDMFLQFNVEPWVITGSLDGTIGIWGMLDKALIRSIQGNCGSILKAQVFAAPDVLEAMKVESQDIDKFIIDQEVSIIAACEDRNIRIWSMQTGQLLVTCETVGGSITDMVTHVPKGWRLHGHYAGQNIYEKLVQTRTGTAKLLHKQSQELRKKKKNVESHDEQRDKIWQQLEEGQHDDVTLAQREALILASSLDGNIYVILARTGIRLRVLVDLLHNDNVDLKKSPIYSMQLFVPPVYQPVKGRKPTLMTKPSELDLVAPEADTINPLLLRKRGNFLDLSTSSANSILKDVTKLANQAGDFAQGLTGAEIDEVNVLKQKSEEAIEKLHAESIVVASKKDGSVCSWNITTGVMMTNYLNMHEGEQSAIPSFCTVNYTDLAWLAEEDAATKKKKERVKKVAVNEDGEVVEEEDTEPEEEEGPPTLEQIAVKNESAASAIEAATAKMKIMEEVFVYKHPVLVTGGIDKILRVTVIPNNAETILRAYYSDLKAKVPKDVLLMVPRAFEKFPRMYLMTQRAMGANNLFSGVFFNIFVIALNENNIPFLKLFLPLAVSGFTLNAREMCVAYQAMRLQMEKIVWLREYIDDKTSSSRLAMLRHYLFTKDLLSRAKNYLKSILIPQTAARTAAFNLLPDKSLLLAAIKSENLTAIRLVLNMWIKLMMTPPADILDQTTGAHMLLTRYEMRELAENFPIEYSYLLSKIVPVKSHPDMQARCNYTLARKATTFQMGSEGKVMQDVLMWKDFTQHHSSTEQLTCFYLPLRDPFDLDLLQLTVAVCERLNTTHLFNSQCLVRIISYAWSAMGRKIHGSSFKLYLFNLFLWGIFLCTSVYSNDPNLPHDSIWDTSLGALFQPTISSAVKYSLVTYSGSAILAIVWSVRRSGEGLLHYILTNAWGSLELTVQCLVVTIIMDSSRKLDNDTGLYSITTWRQRNMISITSLLFFVRFLYYFRALESTGQLVAVLFEIAKRMRMYLFIIFAAMFTFGYAVFVLQAGFPLYRRGNTDLDDDGDDVVGNPYQDGSGINNFGSLKRSIVNSFGFGFNFDFSIFSNPAPMLVKWSILLGCLTSLFVSIILFNLLIAFISNVYAEMSERGTSQWRFMQG